MKTASILSIGFLIATTAQAVTWKPSSNPHRIEQTWNIDKIETHLGQLPTSGAVPSEKTPWPSSYFPHQQNSFNYRADYFQKNSSDVSKEDRKDFFNLKRPRSLSEFNSMTDAEINALSPLEKYSIYINDFTYSLDKKFPDAGPDKAYWSGYCDGWSATALQYAEPKENSIQVGDRILKFSSADLKALLVANTQLQMEKPETESGTITLGNRCNKEIAVPALVTSNGVEHYRDTTNTRGLLDKDLKSYLQQYQKDHSRLGLEEITDEWINQRLRNANAPSCSGVNAGSFHLILANQIGIHKKGFIFDVARDIEIWNQPAYEYTSTITPMYQVPASATAGTLRSVNVKTRLWYADDTLYGWAFSEAELSKLPSPYLLDEYNRYESLLVKNGEREKAGTYPEDLLESVDYEYTLDLGQNDEVIGGNWITYDRPDYIWLIKDQPINENFKKLSNLIRQKP